MQAIDLTIESRIILKGKGVGTVLSKVSGQSNARCFRARDKIIGHSNSHKNALP